MRESLERIGRFDPVRARERFLSSFSPEHTRYILVDGIRAGFVVVKPQDDGLLLDHLYLDQQFQSMGVGAAVLAKVFAEADAQYLALRVGALRAAMRTASTSGTASSWSKKTHGTITTSVPPPCNNSQTKVPALAGTLQL